MDSQGHQALRAREVAVGLCIEGWRFARSFSRLLEKVEPSQKGKHSGQLRFFLKQIEESLKSLELRLVNLEGLPFEVGLPATPVNIEDFDPTDRLLVDQMLIPVIMGPDGLVRQGTILLRKVDE